MSDVQSIQLIFGGMILLFMLLVGIPLVVFLRAAYKATATNRWPTTDGRITSSDVTSHPSLDSNGLHTTIFEPKVVYEYNVSGQPYHSQQISYGAISGESSPGWAQGIVEKYPAQRTVRVFYNPKQPGEAVLEHAGTGCNLILALIMVGIELILAVVCVAAILPMQ